MDAELQIFTTFLLLSNICGVGLSASPIINVIQRPFVGVLGRLEFIKTGSSGYRDRAALPRRVGRESGEQFRLDPQSARPLKCSLPELPYPQRVEADPSRP